MKSRAARLALLVLFVLALGVSTFLFLKSESAQQTQIAAGQAFSDSARLAARRVLDLRAAQQAYVATGQAEDFWTSRVVRALPALREALTTLRASAASGEAQTQIDSAAGSLQDFGQMDVRARDYVRTGQKLTASDMIFSNGSELTEAAVAAIDRAAASELEVRAAAAATFERRQTFALVAAAAAAGLVVLLLLPTGEREAAAPVPAFLERTEPLVLRSIPAAPKVAEQSVAPPDAVAALPPATDPEGTVITASELGSQTADGAAAPAEAARVDERSVASSIDLPAVAALCTELSRVDDTMALPPLLERAASLLGATGIILWMADHDGHELTPVFTLGYPQDLLDRLGTIPRHAENATAEAFRTGLLQTVYGEGESNGAIVAPLVTCAGCVGVMAAEVGGHGEKQDATLAAATILAAQLAALVGPAGVRASEAPVEAANA